MDFGFSLVKKDKKSRARAAIISTPHGMIETPAFSPVATKASVKTLSPEDLKQTGSQVVLGNTYHLYLRPGMEIIKKFGGFGPFMGWCGPTITDSGGYQVSFLWPLIDRVFGPEGEKNGELKVGRVLKIFDKGAIFSSYIDGSKHSLIPEKSMEIQQTLGADIIMSFDQPIGQGQALSKAKEAFARTLKWEERSLLAWERAKKKSAQDNYQALFGITQGGIDRKMRRESLRFVLKMGFDGIAMGGESS